jgi:hypothetical protein
VYPPLFLLLVLLRSLKEGQELAEPHDVHQFVGDDVEQQGEHQVVNVLQGLEDIVVLQADPVKIEGRGAQQAFQAMA